MMDFYFYVSLLKIYILKGEMWHNVIWIDKSNIKMILMGTGYTQRKVDTICRNEKERNESSRRVMIYKRTDEAFLPHGVM